MLHSHDPIEWGSNGLVESKVDDSEAIIPTDRLGSLLEEKFPNQFVIIFSVMILEVSWKSSSFGRDIDHS